MSREFLLAAIAMACLCSFAGIVQAADDIQTSAAEATAAMRKAADFFHANVASHGGYVYVYTEDLQRRYGEGEATADQIWVQPPGTPTVGMAYLDAFEATSDPFYLAAATDAAKALMYGQLESGGWSNSIDFNPQGERVARYRNGKGRGRNQSSLDDDQTQSAIRFLMRLDRAYDFKRPEIHDAVIVALDALLKAQFKNGAFPQGWSRPVDADQPILRASIPKYDWRTEGRIKEYWDMYTLNDGLAGSVTKVLIDADQIYGDARCKQALARLGDFLLLAQLPDPQPAWSQQYNFEMHPIWARKFEPPAVVGVESQDVLESLLVIADYTGDKKYLEPIPRAIAYLRRTLLPDGQLARYYELGTNRPLYMQRKGQEYFLTYDDSDLPAHYGWKSRPRIDKIEAKYERARLGRAQSKSAPRAADLDEQVRLIIREMDEQGRWVSTYEGEMLEGATKLDHAQRFLSSQVFSDNLQLLSAYIKALAAKQK